MTVGDPEARAPSLIERLRGLFGLGGASIREDIAGALEEPTASGDFTAQERTLLRNVLNLHEVRVEDIMVTRADVIGVALATSLADVLSLFRTAGHSRLPVYGDTLDDPRGMVHIRDFMDFLARAAEAPRERRDRREGRPAVMGQLDLAITLEAARILRPVLFVPPSMPALDLLVKMQATRTHMALVIDEYGGTEGLASIEDIVEMIVGDIEDEHDEAEHAAVEAGPDGTFLADARASLEEVAEMTGIDFSGLEVASEVDTIGGLVTTLAGRVPVRGEIVAGPAGREFEVVDADPRRIKRLRILKIADAAPRRRPRPAEDAPAPPVP